MDNTVVMKVVGKSKRRKHKNVVMTILLSLWTIVIVYPFYNSIVISLVPQEVYCNNDLLLYPKQLTLDSYEILFKSSDFLNSFKITVFVVFVGVLYSMLLTSGTAYALSKRDYPGRNIFINIIIFTMYFSGGLIPYYILIMKLGLIDHLAALIIPSGLSIFYMFIMKTHFQSIPASISESAQIDGANEIVIFFKLILPMSMPIIATIILFFSVDKWNDWYSALLFLNDPKKMPLQIVLRNIVSTADVTSLLTSEALIHKSMMGKVYSEGIKMACVTVTMVPIIILYPFLQRYFVKGIMIGSIKA